MYCGYSGAKNCDGETSLDANNNCRPFDEGKAPQPLVEDTICRRQFSNSNLVYISNYNDLYRASYCTYWASAVADRGYWLSGSYQINLDIDASASCKNPEDQGYMPYMPLGNSKLDLRFVGRISRATNHDCRGENGTCIISNLCIHGLDEVGLVGVAGPQVEISDILLSNLNITGVNYVGGFIGRGLDGRDSSPISLRNVGVSNAVIWATGNYVGGLAGSLEAPDASVKLVDMSYIKSASISGVNYVGGLVGAMVSGSISKSTSKIKTLEGEGYVGGLVGRAQRGARFDNVYSIGDGISGQDKVGGLIGSFEDTSDGSIISHFYTFFKNITSGNALSLGGIVGELDTSIVNYGITNGFVLTRVQDSASVSIRNAGLIGGCQNSVDSASSTPSFDKVYYNNASSFAFGSTCGINNEKSTTLLVSTVYATVSGVVTFTVSTLEAPALSGYGVYPISLGENGFPIEFTRNWAINFFGSVPGRYSSEILGGDVNNLWTINWGSLNVMSSYPCLINVDNPCAN